LDIFVSKWHYGAWFLDISHVKSPTLVPLSSDFAQIFRNILSFDNIKEK